MSNKKEDELSNKISNLIPEKHRINMILNLLGSSGVLAEYVMNHNDIRKLPVMIQYVCANSAANMIAIISNGKKASFKDMTDVEYYEMSEQTQEAIYRKMKLIVEELHKLIQENEKL